ncbi:MAG: hypothetical protein ABI477_10640 [Chryseolinea sp.]
MSINLNRGAEDHHAVTEATATPLQQFFLDPLFILNSSFYQR